MRAEKKATNISQLGVDIWRTGDIIVTQRDNYIAFGGVIMKKEIKIWVGSGLFCVLLLLASVWYAVA